MSNADLGPVHNTISDLFPHPQTRKEWEQYQLSNDQLKQFREQGFVAGIRLLDDHQIEVLRSELTEMMNPEHYGREFFYEYHSNESADPNTTLFHALGAWRVRPAFHDLLWNPAFLMPAYQLFGCGFRMFHDQLFSKPAQHGGVVAWHQDYSYWTWTKPMNHLTCWIALDDADESNGCLHYVPGSHRWGLIEKKELAGEMDAIYDVLSPNQQHDFDRKVPIVLKAGEASFHHPTLMHGSYENRSNRSRRATVINTFANGTLSNLSADHAPGDDNYPYIVPGEKMAGEGYPMLLDPAEMFGDFIHEIPTLEE